MTWWILAACLIASGTKLAGYLLPESVMEKPRVIAITNAMTIGLLAALVGLNAVTAEGGWQVDSRILAVLVAAVLLRVKTPFLVVVIAGAAAVALGRAAGLP